MSLLIDTNLLLYSALRDAPEHERSHSWLAERFDDADSFVGLCWPVLYAFARLVTNRRVVGDDAVDLATAWRAVDAFRLQPATRIIEPGEAHPGIARELMETPGLGSNDVPDVQLAALAIEHGLVLCSRDNGFARFAGLRWHNPLG